MSLEDQKGMNSEESPFQLALNKWKLFDLPSFQRVIVNKIEEQNGRVKESLEQRKTLAANAKKFKSLTDEDKLKQWSIILRKFQEGIDQLTERAKASESFTNLCHEKLNDVPDPYPLFEKIVDAVVAFDENEELKTQISQLQARIDAMNQVPKGPSVPKETLDTREDQWKVMLENREKLFQEEKGHLEQQIKHLTVLNEELKSQNKREGGDVTGTSELNLLTEELREERKRIATLQFKIKELSKAMDVPSTDETIWKTKFESLEGDYSELSKKFVKSKEDSAVELTALNRKLGKLERDLKRKNEECLSLQSQQSQNDRVKYLESELQILKQIEFSLDPDDERINDPSMELLRKQILKLSDQNAKLRAQNVRNDDLLEEKKTEILNLKDQLQRAQEEHYEGPERTVISRAGNSTYWGNMSTVIQSSDHQPSPNSEVINALGQQRDKLKQRATDLEQELHTRNSQMQSLKFTLAQLKNENMALHDRFRSRRYDLSSHEERYIETHPRNMDPSQLYRSLVTMARRNPVDFIIYNGSKLILSHKITRLLFLIYFVTLHIFFVKILYLVSNTRSPL